MFENVPAICFKNKDEGLQWLLAGLENINERYKTNYRPFYKILNSAGYGVPQFRERFFLIASIEGKEIVFPEYTHFDVDDLNHHNIDGTPFVTSWDALHDLEIDKTDP